MALSQMVGRYTIRVMHRAPMMAALAVVSASTAQQPTFVNFESPQSHPIDVTPDGSVLVACNTADGVLEVFDLVAGIPQRRGSVAVGVDPVSVRVRGNAEAWVVNHVSDSVSVVDLATMRVRRTVSVGDEPADIVFAGSPQRAFVSLAQPNRVVAFDPSLELPSFSAVTINGPQPRALAVSPDGSTVYVAIFESGNRTTIVPRVAVNNTGGPYGGQNPPPNSGTQFDPPRAAGQPLPPRVAHIVRKNAQSRWMDDNNRDWTGFVNWDFFDNDVAIVNASTLAVSYAGGALSTVSGIGVSPSGAVTAVGWDALNQVRFEPRLNGIFATMLMANVPLTGGVPGVMDLNPHLTYDSASIPAAERAQSVGDPRGVAWTPDGSMVFTAALGTNALVAMSPSGARVAKIDVGEGPSGVVVHPTAGIVYSLNRFEGSVSAVSTTGLTEVRRVPLHDATPAVVKAGRRFLFNTFITSGLGHTSCATCHVDGRSDRLVWDLGDPAGAMQLFDETCQAPNGCIQWHPMKGPMTTQVLQGIVGNGPMHWRGERDNLTEFNAAFTHLQGREFEITAQEMQQLTDYVGSLVFPPNPNRNIDDTLKTSVAIFGGQATGLGGTGNPTTGLNLYQTLQNFGAPPGLTCNACHALPTGTNQRVDIPAPGGEQQNRKNAHLREVWRKVGANRQSQTALRGVGFDHNGEEATLQDLLSIGFQWAAGAQGQQQRRDIEAFMLSFPSGTRAGVGQQVTADGAADDTARINQFVTIANGGSVGLIVKGRLGGEARGWFLQGGQFVADREGDAPMSPAQMLAQAAAGSELTYTMVPAGSQNRLGVDRDLDGFRDRDELDAGSDPADADSVPGQCVADLTGDGQVGGADLGILLGSWGGAGAGDLNSDGTIDGQDLGAMLGAWGACGG
jgi:YVTN family beta-propeller protein